MLTCHSCAVQLIGPTRSQATGCAPRHECYREHYKGSSSEGNVGSYTPSLTPHRLRSDDMLMQILCRRGHEATYIGCTCIQLKTYAKGYVEPQNHHDGPPQPADQWILRCCGTQVTTPQEFQTLYSDLVHNSPEVRNCFVLGTCYCARLMHRRVMLPMQTRRQS